MPTNPYDDLLSGEGPDTPRPSSDGDGPAVPDPLNDPRFQDDGPEALDVVLVEVDAFSERAADFARLLSELGAVDHRVVSPVKRLFVQTEDVHRRGTLDGERQYHLLQEKKFRLIIESMRELAERHQSALSRYLHDVDEHYYSPNRTDQQLAADRKRVENEINLQRKVLGEGAEHLDILARGLADTERRVKTYVNSGGQENISQSEFDLLVRNRKELTAGRQHQFDYTFFDVNLIDRTALTLGLFVPETSGQYLRGLGEIFKL